jgi:hypothetical protein
MLGKVRLVIAAVVAVGVGAEGVPIAAQQQGSLLQGTRALSTAIQGTAVNWTNSAMVNTPIRLRDARRGRVLDSVTTDRFGSFEFEGIEPGSYVVEMMNPASETVLAATPIINVDSGQRVAALVKLPFQSPPLGGALGTSLASVLAITSAAVAAGVLATTVAGAPASTRALPGQR